MRKFASLRYAFKYLCDPAVPFYKKIWIYLVLLYFFSPFDLIPDPLLGFGWLDDIVILILVLYKLTGILERYSQEKAEPHNNEDGVTIDNVEYKVRDD
ncbi:MAG: YkvA family protein [Bacillota bacterium]